MVLPNPPDFALHQLLICQVHAVQSIVQVRQPRNYRHHSLLKGGLVKEARILVFEKPINMNIACEGFELI